MWNIKRKKKKRKEGLKDIVVTQECIPPATTNRLTAIYAGVSTCIMIKKLCTSYSIVIASESLPRHVNL